MSAATDQLAVIPERSSTDLYESATAIGAATVVTLQVATGGRTKVGLCRCKIKWISGTGTATFTPRIFSKTGVTTSGDIHQEYAGAATAVATLFDPSEPQSGPVPMVTDELGRLYLLLAPDAGADNVFRYMLRFYVYR